MVRTEDVLDNTTRYVYENNNLKQIVQNDTLQMTYDYDTHHNVIKATSAEGLVYEFLYDAYGNNTQVSITSGGTTMSSAAEYTDDRNYLDYTLDALGNRTDYTYDVQTGELESVQYPNGTGTTTTYTYDEMYRLASARANAGSQELSAVYAYTDDLLTRIETGSTVYSFTYGDYGMRSSVAVGNRTLAEYSYSEDGNRHLTKLEYGNGSVVEYTYDDQQRLWAEFYDYDDHVVAYFYNGNGALSGVLDSETDRETFYYYDLQERLSEYREVGDGYDHRVRYGYDEKNNLTQLVEKIDGNTLTTAYAYDDDNRITSVTAGSSVKSYTYDGFGRVSSWVTKHGSSTVLTSGVTYRSPSAGKTSGQVSNLSHASSGNKYSANYQYTYDANGNILSVSDGTNTTTYTYDSQNQLIREDNQQAGKIWEWTYDNAGNILTKKQYNYSTGALEDTVNYAYTETGWKDLLTSYDGTAVTYDGIGNPAALNGRSYVWEHGRELKTVTYGGATWTNTYDANGMRTQRVNNSTGKAYSYTYNGSLLSQMTVSTSASTITLTFTYDAAGTPVSVTRNGTDTYYYVTNLQGDVVAILDDSGNKVTEYTYDAWGNPLTAADTTGAGLAALNPLRYRGYVYDEETGLYYLQSRYYDPEVDRFISTDVFVSTGQGLRGNNMFIYCLNQPVLLYDTTGRRAHLVAQHIKDGGGGMETPEEKLTGTRDVTNELNSALSRAATEAEIYKNISNFVFGDNLLGTGVTYLQFYCLVDHEAEWDIKVKSSWNETIGTEYPGFDTMVTYNGMDMTPENLGNFTYGFLGYAYGIPLEHLIPGSWYAAGFPTSGAELGNEVYDWFFIYIGYEYAVYAYAE